MINSSLAFVYSVIKIYLASVYNIYLAEFCKKVVDFLN